MNFSHAFIFFALVCPSLLCAEIEISELRVKEPIPGQDVIAGYFLLKNTSNQVRILRSVSSDAAEDVEIHTHIKKSSDDGHETMRMVHLDFIEIPANAVLEFEPGGHHLMLFEPSSESLDSDQVDIVFVFDDGETISQKAAIESWK